MKLQPQNGLIIKSFFMDRRDKELIRLIPLLILLSEVDDVRTVRDWTLKFKDQTKFTYRKVTGESVVLSRNGFLKSVVNKLHKDYLNQVFLDHQGKKDSFVAPPLTKKCSTKKLLCESFEDLATSDVDYEEIHK